MMTYTVTFPETQHPILRKLRMFQQSKEVTWLYGCYCSGKTSLIRQIFDSEFTFSYPTESVRRVEGNDDYRNHENRFIYSPFILKVPQLADFMDEYILWTSDNLRLAVLGTRAGNLFNSLTYDAFVTNLIVYHQAETQNLLGSLTWLVQVNVFDGVDREFIDFLSHIHKSLVLKCGGNGVPNLIFESWFPDGFRENFPISQLEHVPLRKPNIADKQGVGPARNRRNIKQVVRWKATAETTVNEVYEQSLREYLCATWSNLENNPNTLQIICKTVKEWAGLHFGSIVFVLGAFEEEENVIAPGVTTEQLETMLENYVEYHNWDFENLMGRTSLSLGIGGLNNQGIVQGAWDSSAIYRKKRDLWEVGINIAENEQDIRLIKLVEIYRRNHLVEPLTFPLESDTSVQFSNALNELADWLRSSPADNRPNFSPEFHGFVSSDPIPIFNDNNQETLLSGLINFLKSRDHVLPDHLFEKFYQPFVQNDYAEYQRVQSGQNGQYRICEAIVSNAIVKIRLVELITRIKAYRRELRNE
ncbi:MAG: hypothetical protein KJ069_27340 [Anaerolineae bacterium]|nr:hypothetical protein [Anaerolineae bacterium]